MHRALAFLTALPLALAPIAAPALAQEETGSRGTITAQQFMQALVPYGVWSTHVEFGWVWQPHDVQPWWQPFSVGEWVVTADGSPYWRSGYPFGWATEHYGSWTFDGNMGWLWVPGTEWSAAPVSWRAIDATPNGVVGWAPAIAARGGVAATECAQPAMAWIFVSAERLMTTSNFAAAEKELLSRDAHGTWGDWAHAADGASAHRLPEPSNARLVEASRCLGAAEAKDAFGMAVRARGGTTKGPSIRFVPSRLDASERGTSFQVYAPVVTGEAPAPGGDFLVHPPAPRVERAQQAMRATGASRATPAGGAPAAPRAEPANPAQPALPTPAATPAAPLTPYEAYTYQHAQLNRYHAEQFETLRRLQDSDRTLTPEERKRELMEMQRMAARQRALLDARQRANAERPSQDAETSGR
jgi:hypothetical protein